MKLENFRPRVSGGGRATDLLVRPAITIFHDIMGEAPELDHGDGSDPPPPEENGDRRPEPDWKLVGLLSFMVSFCTVTALQYGRELVKVLR